MGALKSRLGKIKPAVGINEDENEFESNHKTAV